MRKSPGKLNEIVKRPFGIERVHDDIFGLSLADKCDDQVTVVIVTLKNVQRSTLGPCFFIFLSPQHPHQVFGIGSL